MSSTSPSTTSSTTHDPKSDLRQSYDALRKDVSDLTKSLRELSQENLQSAAHDASAVAKKGVSKVEKTIRASPTQSALVAAGIGFMIGLMMRR